MARMGKKVPRQTFADVVREVEETPTAPEPRTGGITDPNGTYWMPTKRQISPSHALALASAGAPVAWDDAAVAATAGSHGSAGSRWPGL